MLKCFYGLEGDMLYLCEKVIIFYAGFQIWGSFRERCLFSEEYRGYFKKIQ